MPSDPQPSRVPRLADGLERLFAALPPERRPALAEGLSRLLATFAPEAEAAPEPPPASAQPAPVVSQAAPPEGATRPRLALHEVILQAYRALAPAQQPAFEEALDTLLREFAAEAGAFDEATAEEAPPQPAPPSPKAEALARLQALALPEGGRHQVEAALRRLVTAMTPPEADLAQALQAPTPEEEAKQAAMPRERLAEVLERVVDRHPADADARALRDEVRFGQLRMAGNEGLVFTIPLWWSRGSGEIRVHERQGEGEHAAGGPSGSTRVVIALDTPHLRGVRIDLLLRERQVNCQVALEDPAAAAFLEPRLPELRDAIEGIGIRVGSLNLRKGASPRKAPGTRETAAPSRLPGVDFYG
ncbi:Flagellar hook-length control protein FliK [compost metagenome]